MGFQDATANVLINFGRFAGRAGRAEFWWWALFAALALAAAALADGLVVHPALGQAPFEDGAGRPVTFVAALALLPPTLAVAARRLHDTGRSAWWLLAGLAPVLGALLLAWFLSQPSKPRANRHGEPVTGLRRTL
jgi:uncharacterized membrane protein YhaH (DUF805 family)